MLSELHITNFAIIDDLVLRFAPGFNVLTGETGAGKSIIIDAVSTLLGGRADTGYVRAGAERAIVEGTFTLDEAAQAAIRPLLEREGLEGESDDTLILAREIRRTGRNICRVNGRAVTLAILEEISRGLVDIHGQSEHLSLLRVREHLRLLDRYGGLMPLREQVAEKVRRLRRVQSELNDLLRDERELARRVDRLQYQIEEIEAARLEVGEDEALTLERNRLANAEQLLQLADEAYRLLYEGQDEQAAAADLLAQAERALTALHRLDPSLEEQRQAAEALRYQLEDVAQSVCAYRDDIEFSPARLRQVEERLDAIYQLKRKYGDTIEDILAFGEAARRELEAIEHSEERVEELRAEEDRLLHEIGTLAAELSDRRREAGQRLAAAIEAQLADLNMTRARFGVAVERTEAEDGVWVGDRRYAFDATGIDRVEFLVAPNVGEPLKPMVKIASGGETARLMLALKTVLSAADQTPTLIFDEIDQGIGGRTGGVVGRKLWGLTAEATDGAGGHQVLCVTHLPQLAGYGDVHHKVDKRVVDGRTVVAVEELSGERRVEELAQMLGTVTDVTREGAREILAEVRRSKSA